MITQRCAAAQAAGTRSGTLAAPQKAGCEPPHPSANKGTDEARDPCAAEDSGVHVRRLVQAAQQHDGTGAAQQQTSRVDYLGLHVNVKAEFDFGGGKPAPDAPILGRDLAQQYLDMVGRNAEGCEVGDDGLV